MALVVENGAGLASAESYVSVAVFKAYMDRRGLSAPDAASEKDLEDALVRGSEAIDGLFGDRWIGTRLTAGQALDWPRAGVFIDQVLQPPGVLPSVLVKAVCEASWREVAAPGSLMPDVDSAARVTSETVGPLSVDYAQPDEAEKAGSTMVFASINKLLGRLTKDGGGTGAVWAYIRRA